MALVVFVVIMAVSLVLAFVALRGSRGSDVGHYLIGGRAFPGWLLFFLSVGEIYSIGTLLGFPAGIYAEGASYGVWFIGYILLAYPVGYYVGPLLWRAARRYNAMTVPDVMRAHFGSRTLEVLVALATIGFVLPYAQFQFTGLHTALTAAGFRLSGTTTVVISVLLAMIYVLVSGVRAPAFVSILKDAAMFGAVIIVALFVLGRGHGPAAVFPASRAAVTMTGTASVYAVTTMIVQSVTFYLGVTGLSFVVTGRSERTVRRTVIVQPLYMLMYPFLVLAAYYSRSHLALSDPNLAFTAAAHATGADWLVGLAAGAAGLTGFLTLALLALSFGGVLSRNLLTNLNPRQQRRWVPVCIAGFLVLFSVLAVTVQSLMLNVLSFAYVIGAQVVPAWLVTLFARRVPAASVAAGIVVGLAIAIGLQAAGLASVHGVNSGLLALAANLAITFGAGALLRRRPRHADVQLSPVARDPTPARA